MTKSVSLTSHSDKRIQFPNSKPIWQTKLTFVWETGDGHAEQTVSLPNMNGRVKAMVVDASAVTANPTLTLNITDSEGATLYSEAALADGTKHYKDQGDFQEIPIAGTLTIGIDPTADPGGSNQTLTVEVIIRGD